MSPVIWDEYEEHRRVLQHRRVAITNAARASWLMTPAQKIQDLADHPARRIISLADGVSDQNLTLINSVGMGGRRNSSSLAGTAPSVGPPGWEGMNRSDPLRGL